MLKNVNSYYFCVYFFSHAMQPVGCGILVPLPGIEPGPSTVGAWNPKHWIAREFPQMCFFIFKGII